MGEQPNPWDLLQPQDVTSRHRGAKPLRRYELLGAISLLSRSTFYPLSDGPSIRNHRITMLYFRTWSTCQSHSQAPLCHCTLLTVTTRHEGTFRSLRYSFGGDHPSQTTHQTMSPVVTGLDSEHAKGRISRVTPRYLAAPLQSLRPILHITDPKSMLSYSKGSRGLSVPLRVPGIFTGTTISPSSWLRQCPDRYTIRAGRNLPDKEFRYLRTVIVTAAVYRGFDSMLLRKRMTSPLNLPAPGRCQTLYIIFRFSRALCFC